MNRKLELNNLIISNIKNIQRGRVQTINKLVHKIKKLKSLADEKSKRKLLKTIDILQNIKTTKGMDIAKEILLLNKNPEKILTDGLSSSKESGIALLSTNKTISETVCKIKTQLNFTDDPTWREIILAESKRQIKHKRTDVKKKKRIERKARSRADKSEEKVLPDNSKIRKIDDSSNSLKKANVTELTDKNKSLAYNEQKDKDEENLDPFFLPGPPESGVDIQPIQQISDTESNSDSRKIRKVKNAAHIEGGCRKSKALKTNDKFLVNPLKITKSSLPSYEGSSKSNDLHPSWEAKKKIKPSILEFKDKDEENLDPFFLPGPPESGVDIQPIQQISDTESNSDSRKIRKVKNAAHIERGCRKSKAFKTNDKFLVNPLKITKSSLPSYEGPSKSNDLHPSWEAKKKIKPSILEFKGKKITFDD